jgi:hypothetical protein
MEHFKLFACQAKTINTYYFILILSYTQRDGTRQIINLMLVSIHLIINIQFGGVFHSALSVANYTPSTESDSCNIS